MYCCADNFEGFTCVVCFYGHDVNHISKHIHLTCANNNIDVINACAKDYK